MTTALQLSINGHDATNDLSPYLLNWTYTDNLSDSIDDLNVTLEDVDAIWLNDWLPEKGATIKAAIAKKIADADLLMDIGLFELDTINGADSRITLQALATSENNRLRGERKSTAWEKTKIKTIFSDVAKRNGMNLYWETTDNPEKERVEQINQSDLAFIHDLAKQEGLCLKLTNNQIVVLDEEDYEKQEISYTIRRKPLDTDPIQIISRRFNTSLTDVFKSCSVKHTANKKTITGSFTPKYPPKTDKVLEIRESVSSVSEANRIAKKRLREKNKQGTTFTFDVYTTVPLRAGMTFYLEGFGKLSGKVIATQVVYSGSRTTLALRKVLEGY